MCQQQARSPWQPMPLHLDRRLRLTPADYTTTPALFGFSDRELTWQVPASGDDVSLRCAQVQHAMVLAWELSGRRPSAAVISRRYGLSKQTLSKVCRGQRWAGGIVMAALGDAVLQTLGTQPKGKAG